MIQFDSMEAFDDHDDAIRQAEQDRFIKLLEALATHKDCQLGEHHEDYVWNSPLGIIEVLTKWDGEPIALIKGEQKPIHTHDIEVFGAPCDCGTRHEYCGECDWVEPCEQEGEQK